MRKPTMIPRWMAMQKLMSAIKYLDEGQHGLNSDGYNGRLTLDAYPAIDVLLTLIPTAVRDEFMLERAERWELPSDAIAYLNSTGPMANSEAVARLSAKSVRHADYYRANLLERGEHA